MEDFPASRLSNWQCQFPWLLLLIADRFLFCRLHSQLAIVISNRSTEINFLVGPLSPPSKILRTEHNAFFNKQKLSSSIPNYESIRYEPIICTKTWFWSWCILYDFCIITHHPIGCTSIKGDQVQQKKLIGGWLWLWLTNSQQKCALPTPPPKYIAFLFWNSRCLQQKEIDMGTEDDFFLHLK